MNRFIENASRNFPLFYDIRGEKHLIVLEFVSWHAFFGIINKEKQPMDREIGFFEHKSII